MAEPLKNHEDIENVLRDTLVEIKSITQRENQDRFAGAYKWDACPYTREGFKGRNAAKGTAICLVNRRFP
jgi:hypothetical protein